MGLEELTLVEPTLALSEQICAYRLEFLENGDSMDGTSNLRRYEEPSEWLKWLKATASKDTCPPHWVPDTQYLCLRKRDGRLVGMIDVRSELNDYCLRYAGHIGYSIRKSERGKGYAKEQLRLALEICRKRGMKRVLVTCGKENHLSAKVICANGGVLESEVYDPEDRTITQRYWIELAGR